MKSAQDILQHHEQKHEKSCVAWGLELILKMHEKIGLNDFPLQSGVEPITRLGPCDWGFGQKERDYLFQVYQLNTKEDFLDLSDFEREAKSESRKGCPPLFSMIGHTWIAVLVGNDLQCLSRTYNCLQILPPLPLAQGFYLTRTCVRPDYQIDCLFHNS
jgi:hypothetical protein